MSTLEISKMTSSIGAEVFGVDLSKPLDETAFAEIRSALLAHLVLELGHRPQFELDLASLPRAALWSLTGCADQ